VIILIALAGMQPSTDPQPSPGEVRPDGELVGTVNYSFETGPVHVQPSVKPFMFAYQKCLDAQSSPPEGITKENITAVKQLGLAKCASVRDGLVEEANVALQQAGWENPNERTISIDSTFSGVEAGWKRKVEWLESLVNRPFDETTEKNHAPNK
jgi:hypothetical protein